MVYQPEGIDQGIDEHEEGGRHQQRELHLPEILPARGALQRGRLGQHRRDLLQCGQVEDHEEAGFLPHRHHHQGPQHGVGVAQPVVRGQAERAGDLLQQAVLGRVEEQPDIGHRDHGQHRRREIGQAQHAAPGQPFIDPQGHQDGQGYGHRDGAQGKPQVVAQGPPEHRIVHHQRIVLQADEHRRPTALGRGKEAMPQRRQRRVVREGEQEHHGRGEQQPGQDGGRQAFHRRARCAAPQRPQARRMRSASRWASFRAASGVLVPDSAACRLSFRALVTRWLSWVDSSATPYFICSRATSAAGTSCRYFFISGVSQASWRGATQPVAIDHWAARAGSVAKRMNFMAACCSAGEVLLKTQKLPPPVGLPGCLMPGSMATPKGKLALVRILVRLPVVVQTMAAFCSRKSLGVVPHSMAPVGMTLSRVVRSAQCCSAWTAPGLSKQVLVPALFISRVSLEAVMAWNIQQPKPVEGIFTPHWLTLPAASRLVSFLAASTISFQVAGALSGFRPASLNRALLQYITMVERWKGMPQVLPSVWLFSMKPLQKPSIHFLSSALLARLSMETMAPSSISVNRSVDSSTASVGGVPPLKAVSALTMLSWQVPAQMALTLMSGLAFSKSATMLSMVLVTAPPTATGQQKLISTGLAARTGALKAAVTASAARDFRMVLRMRHLHEGKVDLQRKTGRASAMAQAAVTREEILVAGIPGQPYRRAGVQAVLAWHPRQQGCLADARGHDGVGAKVFDRLHHRRHAVVGDADVLRTQPQLQ
eukprot:TRINITY_DN435_c5_g1_i1.p1 TRINITY_DN435_c5_g1~~TRINITY_DN435_c5_g1_i1.p1  ORF type:complete len:766 (+),score=253.47 TRINITY_DN435_c5_g1_i1:968-3265(+)